MFEVGDKVKCVRGTGTHEDAPNYYLEEGKVYTVSHFNHYENFVGLKETNDTKAEWDVTRFELVEEEEATVESEIIKAVCLLQNCLAHNKATISISAEEIEVFRNKEDECFSVEPEDLERLLEALDVIEEYTE